MGNFPSLASSSFSRARISSVENEGNARVVAVKVESVTRKIWETFMIEEMCCATALEKGPAES